MLIGVLGDTHANPSAARFMLWTMHRMGISTLIQVGDFGIYTDNSGMKFANNVNHDLMAYEMEMIVVPGNHENYRVINEMIGDTRTEYANYRSNIKIAPRGMRDEFGGMSFVFLGGAPSVDRSWRVEFDSYKPDAANKNWYAEEMITPADVEYVISGGYADVMVCHDAPHGVQGVNRIISGNPHGFAQVDLVYAEVGRNLVTEAFRGVAPKLYLHGHYHTPVYENIQTPGGEWGDETLIIGLDCEFNNYSMAVLDTESGDAINIDHTEHLRAYRNHLNGRLYE